jgi:PKD repeat protein
MTMDDYLDAGLYSLNEAWLRVNLGGLSDVELTFWWKEFGDEDHPEDGVFFSDNGGASFVKVYDLIGGTTTYQQIILDVDQLAATNGLSLTSNFVIKFSQYDNYMIATDGFAFDDISVVSSETPPVADFEASPTSGCAPLVVNFTDLSSGNPTSWSWDFGDGGTSSLQNPSYTYDTAGTYTVTLTATNAYGSDDEVKVDMIVADDCSVSHALSDIPVAGYVSGNYTNTHSSDLVYESIQEEISTGHPVKIWSFLEHKWDFNITAGNTIDFYVEAYRTDNTEGDNFDFEYSTNGTDFTYLLTVNSSALQTYNASLPNSLSGTVYIRVVDTDQSRGNTAQDYVYIDHMWIISQGSPPPPDTMYVYSIDVTRIGGRANRYQGQAVVTVYNQDNQPVEGALVEGHFTGPSSDNASGSTGADGKATILSQEVKGPVGTWCFYVDNVSLGSNIYDPSRNVENYDCEPPAKEIADLLPDHFELGQNHPNPFNPATSIHYSVPVASHVTITIYNILGEKVCSLVDRTVEPGYHSVIWNGTDSDGNTVSTGVYFYSMTAGDFSDTRKLLMMK